MLAICDFCRRLKFGVAEKSVGCGPGTGKLYQICPKCLRDNRLPKSFEEQMGMVKLTRPNAKFIQYVGQPHITASKYGVNAYGSVLAEYDDGSRMGVICGHGGSAWLCLTCAQECMEKQSKELNISPKD